MKHELQNLKDWWKRLKVILWMNQKTIDIASVVIIAIGVLYVI